MSMGIKPGKSFLLGATIYPEGVNFSLFSKNSTHETDHPDDWKGYARKWLQDHGVVGNLVVLTEGPSAKHPEANNRMEIIDLERKTL